MSYFLDTNTCIAFLRGISPSLEKKIKSLRPSLLKIPSIVKAELLFAGQRSIYSKKVLPAISALLAPFDIITFGDLATEHYAKIRSDLAKQGRMLGPHDLIIAATALTHHGVLITPNVREFSRVPELKVEDWTR